MQGRGIDCDHDDLSTVKGGIACVWGGVQRVGDPEFGFRGVRISQARDWGNRMGGIGACGARLKGLQIGFC